MELTSRINVVQTVVKTYQVKINVNKLNVRSKPNTNSVIITQLEKNKIYTIVEEREGWGKLKSGIGWINLQYTQKV